MTIKPLKSYTPPAYPTQREAAQDAHLLERVPRRWGKGNPIATLIGTGILIHIAGTGCRRDDTAAGADTKGRIVAPAEHEQENVRETTQARVIPVTRVAPILEDALANDGRGSFGCVASSAPVFLSEDEAMDLIRTELKKIGLKLTGNVTVDGLQIPSQPPQPDDEDEMALSYDKKTRAITPESKKLAEGSYTFDLGTEDKSVVIKLLNVKDFNAWSYGEDWSSIQRVHFPWLTSRMRDAFAKRDTGEPVVIGLFFDPTVYPDRKFMYDWEEYKKDPEKEKMKWRQGQNEAQNIAREKLRQQVAHFAEYLKKEGVAK